jgi:hypothetical protein
VMTAADRQATPLPGVGVLIPAKWCAVVGDAWRLSRVPEFRAIGRACDEVAADFTDRQLRGSGAGTALTVEQAAVMLRMSPGFVRRLLRSGDLEGRKGPAGIWAVERMSVERRMNGHSTRAGAGSRAAA